MGQRNLNSQNQKLLAKLLSGHEKKKGGSKSKGFMAEAWRSRHAQQKQPSCSHVQRGILYGRNFLQVQAQVQLHETATMVDGDMLQQWSNLKWVKRTRGLVCTIEERSLEAQWSTTSRDVYVQARHDKSLLEPCCLGEVVHQIPIILSACERWSPLCTHYTFVLGYLRRVSSWWQHMN